MLRTERSSRVLHRALGHAGHSTFLRLECLEVRATPATLMVDDDLAQNKNAKYTSIQAAVDAARSGDRIHVYSGTYDEQITISNKPPFHFTELSNCR